jgi:hypothetical protein
VTDYSIFTKTYKFLWPHRFLIGIFFLTFLLRLPSLFEPLWYGDEAIYLTAGQKILHGGLMYVDIFDHKTPGIYYLTAGALGVFGQSVWAIKFLLTIWVLVTLVVFYLLGRKLFNKKVALTAVIIFSLLTSLPIIEGNIFNSEILMLLPIAAGVLLGMGRKYFLAGVFFSLALLLKVPAIFDFAAFFVFASLTVSRDSVAQTVKSLSILAGGFLTPIFLTIAYFGLRGALASFFDSTFLYNVSYTGYGNKIIFENDLLILKALPILLILIYSLFRIKSALKSKKGAPFTLKGFLAVWLVFSFYGAVFGGRAYEHYLIQALPAFSLIVAVSFFDEQFRKIGIFLVAVVVAGSFLLNFRPWFSFGYYTNVFNFVTNKVSFDKYVSNFDPVAQKNYALSSFLTGCEKYRASEKCLETRTSSTDTLYIFADRPSIYFLSRLDPASKYITFFHIAGNQKAQEEVAEEVKASIPKYILVKNPFPGSFLTLVDILSARYNLFASYEDMAIYKINKFYPR